MIGSGTGAEGTLPDAGASPRSARLVRRADRRVIAGVAGGIADRIGVRPLVVRLVFVALAIGAGAGVLLYLALWWLLPRSDMPESGSEGFLRRFPQAPAWAGRILLIVGVAVVASQIAPNPNQPHWSPPLVIGAVLVAIGVALFRQDLVRERTLPSPVVLPSPPDPGAPDVTAPVESPAVRTEAAGRERAPRERSRLGVLTAGSALIALSIAVLLDGVGAITLEVGRFPAIALVVVGAGLLVGAWWGRARGAIALGVLILPLALVLSLIHQPFGGEITVRDVYPRRGDPFPASQRLLAGRLVVNLMNQDLAGSIHSLDIEVGAGIVDVVVPRDVTIHLVAEVGMGALNVAGHPDRVGVDLIGDLSLTGAPGGGVLILRVDQGIGTVDVARLRPIKARQG